MKIELRLKMAGLVAMQLKQKRLKNMSTKVDLDFEDEEKSDPLQTTPTYFWQRNYEVRNRCENSFGLVGLSFCFSYFYTIICVCCNFMSLLCRYNWYMFNVFK